MPELQLRLDGMSASHIRDSACAAIRIAGMLNVVVKFHFNTVDCTVGAGSDPDAVVAEYRRALEGWHEAQALARKADPMHCTPSPTDRQTQGDA